MPLCIETDLGWYTWTDEGWVLFDRMGICDDH